jgi:hypothetical protein
VNIKIYGDKPAVYDFRSLVRAWLWRITKIVLKLYLIIERGTGRGLWKNPLILEPQMFAIAQKPLKIA